MQQLQGRFRRSGSTDADSSATYFRPPESNTSCPVKNPVLAILSMSVFEQLRVATGNFISHQNHIQHLLRMSQSMHRDASRNGQARIRFLEFFQVGLSRPCATRVLVNIKAASNLYSRCAYSDFGVGIMFVAPIIAGRICIISIVTVSPYITSDTAPHTVFTVTPSPASTVARFWPMELTLLGQSKLDDRHWTWASHLRAPFVAA